MPVETAKIYQLSKGHPFFIFVAVPSITHRNFGVLKIFIIEKVLKCCYCRMIIFNEILVVLQHVLVSGPAGIRIRIGNFYDWSFRRSFRHDDFVLDMKFTVDLC